MTSLSMVNGLLDEFKRGRESERHGKRSCKSSRAVLNRSAAKRGELLRSTAFCTTPISVDCTASEERDAFL